MWLLLLLAMWRTHLWVRSKVTWSTRTFKANFKFAFVFVLLHLACKWFDLLTKFSKEVYNTFHIFYTKKYPSKKLGSGVFIVIPAHLSGMAISTSARVTCSETRITCHQHLPKTLKSCYLMTRRIWKTCCSPSVLAVIRFVCTPTSIYIHTCMYLYVSVCSLKPKSRTTTGSTVSDASFRTATFVVSHASASFISVSTAARNSPASKKTKHIY